MEKLRCKFKAERKNTVYEFIGRFYKSGNDIIMDIQYGYEWHYGKLVHEGFDSVLKGRAYRIFYQTLPLEGDVIEHIKSGRKFVLGKDLEGFLVHKFPMIEDGKVKGYLRCENYYKD